MDSLKMILILFIALEHFGFFVLETFLWTKPIGMKIFRTKPEFAFESSKLAMNQGLYNGFLAGGLIWSFFLNKSFASSVQLYFLLCILIAGIFGSLTVNKRIFFVQAVPSIIAILTILFY